MITLIMTSASFTGQVKITYNEANYLAALDISEPLSHKQYNWLLSNLPFHMDAIPAFKKLLANATIIEKKIEVTFEMFWNRYNDKERSSKKKTLTAWDKLSEADQVKAYLFIPVYERKRGNADKKYATTYLSDQLWNN